MDQWLSNLSPLETYLIAVPAIMLGSILFLGGIILLLKRRNKNDAETLEAIRKDLEKAGAEFQRRRATGMRFENVRARRPKPTPHVTCA
jgi:hypothetical protein